MNNVLKELEAIIADRKTNEIEGSYTNYLFSKGIDKILKKVGEECTETIIACKNGDKNEVCLEVCDLIYHLLVMMNVADVKVDEIYAELEKRALKQKNLKEMKVVDKNT